MFVQTAEEILRYRSPSPTRLTSWPSTWPVADDGGGSIGAPPKQSPNPATSHPLTSYSRGTQSAVDQVIKPEQKTETAMTQQW